MLRAAYEGTLAVAASRAQELRKPVDVFLTALGGGAFGNHLTWIRIALIKALITFRRAPLRVFLVHYKTIDEEWNVIPQGTFSQRKVKRFQAVATSEDYVQKWVEETEAFDEQLPCSGCGNVGTGYRKLWVSNPRVAICGDCLRVGVTDA